MPETRVGRGQRGDGGKGKRRAGMRGRTAIGGEGGKETRRERIMRVDTVRKGRGEDECREREKEGKEWKDRKRAKGEIKGRRWVTEIEEGTKERKLNRKKGEGREKEKEIRRGGIGRGY